MPALTPPDNFSALTVWQQQAYLNGDPNYMAATDPNVATAPTWQQQAAGLATSDNYTTISFGNASETVWTLESYLSTWAAGAVTEPASLQGEDPMTTALQNAKERCAVIPTPDCANLTALAAQYGSAVKQGIASYPGVYAKQPAPAFTAPATPTAPAPTAQSPAAPAGPVAPAAPTSATPTPRASGPDIYSTPHAAYISGGDTGGDIGSAGGTLSDTLGQVAQAAWSFVPIIGPILGAIFGMFFGGNDTAALGKAVQQLSNDVAQLGDNLTRFIWKVANGLGRLVSAIADIWDNFLDALWSAIKSIWKAIWCVVSSIIPKIIDVLRNMRKYLDWIYQNIIRPIMNYLQKVRKILQILKLLHIPFAAKLDRILGQVQSAILGPFFMLLRWFNTYGYWINTIIGKDLTLQKPIFINTMYKYSGDWIGMFWSLQQNAAPAGAIATGPAPSTAPSQAQVVADFDQYADTDSGRFAVVAVRSQTVFQQLTASL